MTDALVWTKDSRSIGYMENIGDEGVYMPVIFFNFKVISYISGPGTDFRGYELKILTTDGPEFIVPVEVCKCHIVPSFISRASQIFYVISFEQKFE